MPDAPTERKRWIGDHGLRAMVGIGTAILVVGALAIARPVFAPLAFALFIITLVWPLQDRLQRIVPKMLALAVSIVATVTVVGVFGWIITWAFTRVGRALVNDAARFQALYDLGTAWLEDHGIVVATLWAEHFNAGWVLVAVQEVTSRLNSTLSFAAIMLIYVLLGLLEVDTMAKKLRLLPNGGGRVLLRGAAQTGAKLRKYMLVRTLMSLIVGGLTWGFLALAGVPLAMEWGVIAFVLNYVPVIGSLAATVLPSLFATAHFAVWQNAILVFLSLNIIQFAVGNYLEPLVAGNVLSMSPFVVLFSVFFWTYLWGLLGAFIGIPIVIAILTLCAQHPASRWVSDVFGSDPGEAA